MHSESYTDDRDTAAGIFAPFLVMFALIAGLCVGIAIWQRFG